MKLALIVGLALSTTSLADTPTTWTIDLGRGPVNVQIPRTYDANSPAPVLIALHGYQTTGEELEAWWQMAPVADAHGVLYATPTGDTDFLGLEYWNATDACCDLFGENPDDSGYLRSLVEAIQANFNIDPRRIYFAGHSNGGFMSYRMACDHADLVAAIASLAGATFDNPNDCAPSEPVDVLQIHGTNDGVIGYNGGSILGTSYPSAMETVQTWATYDDCTLVPDFSDPNVDIDADIPGAETTIERYSMDCMPGGSSQLWTIPGGPHSPNLAPGFAELVIQYLLDHPKPILCPGDTNRDGVIDTIDLLALLGSWGACGQCASDLNDDGIVNAVDLLALLAAWGDC